MLTNAQFNEFWKTFGGVFPAAVEYVNKQEIPSVFLDGVYQSLAAFDPEVLAEVTNGMIKGYLEVIPNTQLGQLGNELRIRCREVLDQRRKQRPQEWQDYPPKWSPSQVLDEPRMKFMLACAQAAERLTEGKCPVSVKVYQSPGSVRPERSPHDAAIIMGDTHTPEEEARCIATFEKFGLTWEMIQAEARLLAPPQESPSQLETLPVVVADKDHAPREIFDDTSPF